MGGLNGRLRGGEGEGRFSFTTSLGSMTICWTREGISGVSLPRDGSRGEPPIGHPPKEAVRLAREVQAYFQGKQPSLDVRMDLSGTTAFQRSVYKAARSIPPGSVRTYGEIARKIGRPGAARAVGTALGKNPIPLLIPCHRVVGSTGLGGFSSPGGLSLKKRLLALEAGASGPWRTG
ncbi:MAG: methylated-DNA--[protein]-cysteine S-methyltransferase [Planctomycetota bacterium]|nr:methylated-DNA--[protein]-cysteine S-methyltransferase [Planctomycetota bacterium]